MEAFETFKKLSDSEKVKFFEAFFNNSKERFSNSCDENSQIRNPETSHLSILLENLKNGQKVCDGNLPGSNCEVGDPREKQKTLDSWLIKRNDVSPNKSKLEESCQTKQQADTGSNSIVNNVLESCSDVVQATVSNTNNANSPCLLNSVSNDNHISRSSKHSYCESDTTKDDDVKGALTSSSNVVESPDIITEKYKLRSKRKFIELSPIAEHKSTIKYLKNGDSSLVNDCDKDFNCLDKLNKKSTQSWTTDISDIPYCSLPEDTNTSQDCFNHIQHIKENDCSNTNNVNVPLENRKPYNLRTKRKDSKLQNSLESSKEIPCGVITSGDLNNKNKTVRNNKQNMRTVLSPQSNYEAFSRLAMECSQMGLNIMDILQHEKIQNLLNDHEKLSNEAVVFLGSYKSSTGEKLPVVHLLESKKRLLESLHELQKPL